MRRAVIAAFIAGIFFGCDIFEVRPTEKPDTARSNFEFPSTPQIVITNLMNAMKEQNVENYLLSLCDSMYSRRPFIFIPYSGAATIYPGLAGGWGLKQERQYAQNLFAQTKTAQGVTLSFDNPVYASYGDSTLFSARYSISILKRNSEIAQVFNGEIRVTFILDNRLYWTIATWQDINNSSGQCWSDLKGLYY
jgi:hypothetical protein